MGKLLKYVNGEMYSYEIYPLVDKFDPILTQKTEEFRFVDTFQPRTPVLARELAVSLIETMKARNGIGLAANQCGIPLRVFVMGSEGVGYAFFNPEILETTGETGFEEGCLTFPGLFLPIRRPESVKIKYQDMNGEFKEQTFSGLSARIILHEYDHMEGIVYTSKVPKMILERQKKKVYKNIKILNRQKIEQEKQEIIRKAMEKVALDARKKMTPDSNVADPGQFLKFTANTII
jgi:peptide deformylase